MDTFLKDMFKEKKLKLTPQRIAIYNYLKNNKNHPSVETIYNYLREDYPTLSLATVYKTIKTFVECNIVQEINLSEGNFRYDFKTENHPHVQCVDCNEIMDMSPEISEKIKKVLIEESNIDVIDLKIYIYNRCEKCSALYNIV